jgi:hypothetical protein
VRKGLHKTLNQLHHHLKLWYQIDELKCKDCQKYKLELAGRVYGLLPKQEVRIAPWEEIAIDLTPRPVTLFLRLPTY